MNNELLYFSMLCISVFYGAYKLFFYTKSTTDADDVRLLQAYVEAKKRRLIK